MWDEDHDKAAAMAANALIANQGSRHNAATVAYLRGVDHPKADHRVFWDKVYRLLKSGKPIPAHFGGLDGIPNPHAVHYVRIKLATGGAVGHHDDDDDDDDDDGGDDDRKRPTLNCAAQMGLSRLGNENARPPVTLPRLIFLAGEDDPGEAAERIAVTRTIRAGRNAWEAISQAETFEAWTEIGAALAIGKQWALRTSGANRAWGSTYSKAFNKWSTDYGFTSMRPSDRSYAIELHENLGEITAWRDTLPERQRNRLIGAQANVKRWRAAIASPKDGDPHRAALIYWHRFRTCLEALPGDQAADL